MKSPDKNVPDRAEKRQLKQRLKKHVFLSLFFIIKKDRRTYYLYREVTVTDNICEILPSGLKKIIFSEKEKMKKFSGIRIKTGYPAVLTGEEELIPFPGEIIKKEDAEAVVSAATENSLYAYMDEIRNGYITVRGGHRLGICGSAVYENGKIKTVKNISGINIRIAREVIGAADGVLSRIAENGIQSTLIISPPGGGKTTLLRDIARSLGNRKGMRPVVIDSRWEIAAGHNGSFGCDVGARTFVLCGYKKKEGFSHAVRALSPNVILCDEIGSSEDAEMIRDAALCGVSVIATAHGRDIEDIKRRSGLNETVGRTFRAAVLLDKRRITKITEL